MRKRLLLLVAVAALSASAFAQEAQQEAPKQHFKPYGFIRSYAAYDTRATKSLSEDLFFFVPLDEYKVDDVDVNAHGVFNYQAITTRLGLDIKGYKVGNTGIEGKIEADFYCLSSGGNIGTLRMRQAYVKLLWGDNDGFNHNLLIGQAWHPLAADLANTIALETGAPFSPFNRSAQIMYNANLACGLTFTAGLVEQMQYRSSGPDGGTNKYQRNAILPEVYAGLSFKKGGFLGRVGVSALSIRPHYGYATIEKVVGTEQKLTPEGYQTVDKTETVAQKYDEWLTTFNPFVFLQYTGKNFQVKAKAVYAQAGEHMQLNGGYAATALKADGISYEYTPTRSVVGFISGQGTFGKVQLIGMVGYQRNLGLEGGKKMLDESLYYYSGNGFKNAKQMIRATPTLAYNIGKLQLALEYDFTAVQYGGNSDGKVKLGDDFNADGSVVDARHWISNHRILFMTKYSF